MFPLKQRGAITRALGLGVYDNEAPVYGGIGAVKGAASPLIASNQLLSARLTPPGVLGLLIFCQKVKRTVIMLPFEIPSLHQHPPPHPHPHPCFFYLFIFCSRNKMHLIGMYAEPLRGYIFG